MRGPALAFVAAALAAARADAGAWPLDPGEGRAISSFTYDRAIRAFDDDGNADAPADFDKLETSVFLEYGLTPRFTLVAQPVVQTARIADTASGATREETGFASSQIGLRWLAHQGERSVVSFQTAVVAPGAGENVINAPFGDGGLAGEARALAGRGWGDAARGGFVEAQTGWRWRTDGDADEARLDLTLGLRPSARWELIGQSFSIWSVDAAPDEVFESHKAQLSAVRRLNDRFAVQFGGYASYAGRDVIDERAGFVALWMMFGKSSVH